MSLPARGAGGARDTTGTAKPLDYDDSMRNIGFLLGAKASRSEGKGRLGLGVG